MTSTHPVNAKCFTVSYDKLITILVGPEEIRFQVHENGITRSSDFFRKACSGEFKEAKEKTIRLPEMHVHPFTSYAHWAYTGQVKLKAEEDNSGEPGKILAIAARLDELIRIYIAADVLRDVHLRNAAIDHLVAIGNRHGMIPGPALVCLAYSSTAEGSKLRELFADYYIDFADAKWFSENGQDLPKAFLFDVLHRKMIKASQTTESGMTVAKWWEQRKYWDIC